MTPSVAIIGGAPLAQTNGLFTALAVNALNALLGSVERPGGVFFMPQINLASAAKGSARRAVASASLDKSSRASSMVHRHRRCSCSTARIPFSARRAWRVREALDEGPVHRQLRQLPRRDQRARGSDPAGPLVSGVVDRGAARIGRR